MTVADEWQSQGVGTSPRPSCYGIRAGRTCTARRLLLVSREPWVRVSRWQRPSIDIREFCEESAQRIWNAARGDQDGATRPRVEGEPLRRPDQHHCYEGATLVKDIQSEQRRKLLLAAGALAAQACLPLGVARGLAPGRLKKLVLRHMASIVPVPLNPYFVPQGVPLAVPSPAGAPFSGTALPGSAPPASTLVLYDTTGPWGWLGEIYATMAGNLASHFGAWVALPVVSYTAGTLQQYSACIYIGSTYGEPRSEEHTSELQSPM